MGLTEAVVTIIAAALAGGTIRSVLLYFKDRGKEKRRLELGSTELEVSASMVAGLQQQITAMGDAFEQEREAWRTRDRLRGDRIAELETELRETRDRLGEAQTMLARVTQQVEQLTQKLTTLSEGHREV